MLVALAGGVGAAKFLRGLLRVHDPGDLVVVGNTGDDLRMHGLAVSPDLDSVAYTLAGLADEERGWGLAGETWNVREALVRLGEPGWFALGDRDIATHLLRTRLLAEGASLSEATAELCRRLGVPVRLDGQVACWGRNTFGQASPPAGGFRLVSAGWDYACGVRTDERVACFAELDKKIMTEVVPWVPFLWSQVVTTTAPSVTKYEFDQFSGFISLTQIAVNNKETVSS
jgi:hypothetical protein